MIGEMCDKLVYALEASGKQRVRLELLVFLFLVFGLILGIVRRAP